MLGAVLSVQQGSEAMSSVLLFDTICVRKKVPTRKLGEVRILIFLVPRESELEYFLKALQTVLWYGLG